MLDLSAIELRQDIKILTMFMIVQFLGLLLATQVYSGATLVEVSSAEIGTTASTAVYFIAGILVFTAILLLIIRVYSGRKFFLLIEAFAVFGASYIVFLIVIGILTGSLQSILFGNSLGYQFVLAAAGAAVLIAAKNKWPRLRNTASIIASVGIGVIIGLDLSFLAVFVFMMLLAVYDYVAVFITKHMVTMGQAMSDMNLAFLVGAGEAEAVPKGALTPKQAEYAERNKKLLEKNYGKLAVLENRNMEPIFSRRELGNGDLAVPLMVAVSAYKVYQNFLFSFFIIFGAIFGLAVTFYILRKYRRPLPAIPPLLAGISLAIVIYFFVV